MPAQAYDCMDPSSQAKVSLRAGRHAILPHPCMAAVDRISQVRINACRTLHQQRLLAGPFRWDQSASAAGSVQQPSPQLCLPWKLPRSCCRAPQSSTAPMRSSCSLSLSCRPCNIACNPLSTQPIPQTTPLLSPLSMQPTPQMNTPSSPLRKQSIPQMKPPFGPLSMQPIP